MVDFGTQIYFQIKLSCSLQHVVYKCELKYHRSTSFTYHLYGKHTFSDGDHLMISANCKPSQHQPTLMELKEKAKPMEQSKFDAIIKAIAKLIDMNGRPTNIVTDEGLQDVVRIAANNQSYVLL